MKNLIVILIGLLSFGIYAQDSVIIGTPVEPPPAVLPLAPVDTLHTYKKIMTGLETYKIGYFYKGKFQKYVQENKPDYVIYCGQYQVEVIPYVPPAPLTIEEKRAKVAQLAIDKQNKSYDAGFEFDGKIYPSNLQYREFMATGVRIAENNPDVIVQAICLDGSAVELNAVQIINLQKAYDSYCLAVYNTFIQEMALSKAADESALDYYLINGVFE